MFSYSNWMKCLLWLPKYTIWKKEFKLYIYNFFFFITVYPSVDPCYNYTVLDEPWRANSSRPSNSYKFDRSVTWSGWYRLFINGVSTQIPDTCVEICTCGTDIPLWIRGGHPTVEDGVVTRDVCGHWNNYCCYYGSYPIKVKACPGNYYVYELVRPTLNQAEVMRKSHDEPKPITSSF
uniref:UMOD/GP2/OIT3-like D8C domain-containing protein n=1 Tax=Sinocyclocheilus grahami TaxID=75366 RepID=A0A672L568_SINGR